MNRLKIQDFSVQVHLGVTAAERASPQEVRVGLELIFAEKPAACASDEISDTLCYASICKSLLDTAQSQEFKTIEHLGQKFVNAFKAVLPPLMKVRIQVHKVKPPIDGLLGGVIYEQESH